MSDTTKRLESFNVGEMLSFKYADLFQFYRSVKFCYSIYCVVFISWKLVQVTD